MVKHTQTIRQQNPVNCVSVFDHFVWLALKGLNSPASIKLSNLDKSWFADWVVSSKNNCTLILYFELNGF